jgi:uncharacterized integral membrane protein (TIGR00697 family)
MKKSITQPKYLITLTLMCATFLLICLVLQDRLILIGPTYVCSTVFIYPFTCLTLDIIAEIYGRQAAKNALWLSILSTIMFSIIVTIFTKIPGPIFWKDYTNSYNIAMHPLIRIVAAGTISILIGQLINIYVITRLKVMAQGRYFAFRSMGSSIVGDTVTFAISLIGFFAKKLSIHEIIVITISELAVMYTYALLIAFPGSIIVAIIKKYEHQSVQCTNVSFNPFLENNQNLKEEANEL